MKNYSGNRLNQFVWGSVCGAIAALLVFTALFFLDIESAGRAVSQSSVGEFLTFVPWLWLVGISGVFGCVNLARRKVDGGALAYLE